jgi:uncharacterized protein (DUF2141 family)
MRNLISLAVVGTVLSLAAPSGATVLGPDPAACAGGSGAAALVRVEGFKQRSGNLRVQAYQADPGVFLVKGKWLARVDVPVTPRGRMEICVPLPAPGEYAIAVRHDVDGSGSSGWSDGGGFSRNPKLSLLKLKPEVDKVAVAVTRPGTPVDVTLNYRQGLSIGPVATH